MQQLKGPRGQRFKRYISTCMSVCLYLCMRVCISVGLSAGLSAVGSLCVGSLLYNVNVGHINITMIHKSHWLGVSVIRDLNAAI